MSVGWMFTDRTGGFSSAPYHSANLGLHVGDDPDVVLRNREVLRERADVDGLVTMTQVHGAVVCNAVAPGDVGEADAVVTNVPRLALVVQVADCVPVLLSDESAGVISAVHAGWRGAVADVVQAAVERMCALGAQPQLIRARIGPAICGKCYEVGPEVVEQVGDVMPVAPGVTAWGTPSVDLRAGMLERLARLGVIGELVGGCTFEDPATYFSYRRDTVTGRQAGVVWLS